jgi:8-oxo-dGTP pyrophosphatase MutT (NUDIX family)
VSAAREFAGSELDARERRAVRTLQDPPSAPGWNHAEIADLLGPGSRRAAAVLVATIARADGPSILFTRRTEHLAQHAGQVSFPGGGVESADADSIAAALRETREEVGIDAALVQPFGYLDCFETISGYCVTPVVAQVDPGYRATPDPREVADVFEAPLAFFLDPANRRQRRFDWRGKTREVWEFAYNDHIIWGATAAMLLSLVRRIEATP